jgi:hypothetical protein
MVEWSRAKFCDVVNLFLGTILFFSPWLFTLSLGTPRQTADRRTLSSGAVGRRADSLRGLGGMVQPSRRAVESGEFRIQ